MKLRRATIALIIALMIIPSLDLRAQQPRPRKTNPSQNYSGKYISFQMPNLFAYDELLELGAVDPIRPALKEKLNALRTTPFISNQAYYSGARPLRPSIPLLGPSMRVVLWNIERGLRLNDIKPLFKNKKQFLKLIDTKELKLGSSEYKEVLNQIDLLQTADVLVLNELDWGMKRTEYREVVRELGSALGMNWAYGVEFVEIDPINLGTEEFEEAKPEDREEMRKQIAVDKTRLRALHGTAVLSRYPIKDAKLQPLSVGYDWYEAEKNRVSEIEKGKRTVSEKVFLEKIKREIRRGGRTMLTVTLDVPDLPEGELVIATPHLENRSKPEKRQEQMKDVLSNIRGYKSPVILAGDLNTSLRDDTPTTLKREIGKRLGSGEFWAKAGIKYATGVGFVFDALSAGINFFKNQQDPTVKNVPIVAPNPEEGLFKMIEEFRFDDGGAFDFRGDSKRTSNKQDGTLANSNQRASKGFAETYQVERTIGPAGKLKLDWIFVKPYINNPRSDEGSYKFAPHFPRTMEEVNYSVEDRISDHNPMIVDLPFNEPNF